ncbi:hypothetical protein D3C80_1764050 [compost metagenome]
MSSSGACNEIYFIGILNLDRRIYCTGHIHRFKGAVIQHYFFLSTVNHNNPGQACVPPIGQLASRIGWVMNDLRQIIGIRIRQLFILECLQIVRASICPAQSCNVIYGES